MIFGLLALTGFAAGIVNVLAGGGSFLTLPAMIAAGLDALSANASSTVALFPAQTLAAALARDGMVLESGSVSIATLAIISIVGGLFGAILLLVTPAGIFLQLVPWLILFSTIVFAAGSLINREARRIRLPRPGIYVAQGLVAIYGGYFGGGIGIMMLAALTLFGLRDMLAMNSIKVVLAMLTNVAAFLTFAFTNLVHWPQTLVLGTGALCGAAVGTRLARVVPAAYVRWGVIIVGVVLTAAFLVKAGFF